MIPNFTLITFGAAIDCLRMANQLAGKEIYQWSVMSADDQAVTSSNYVSLVPNSSASMASSVDVLVVCSGEGVRQAYNKNIRRIIVSGASAGIPVGALSTGTYLLARSGLMDGFRCTIQADYLDSLKEEFPKLDVTDKLYEIDRNRFTCSGGTASLGMILKLISKDVSTDLAFQISEAFNVDRIPESDEQQSNSIAIRARGAPAYLMEAERLMQSNIAEPLFIEEIAMHTGISKRQLERGFKQHLSLSPVQYYMQLRLRKSRYLLRHSGIPINQIAIACGFNSLQHFSLSFKKFFKTRPSQERR